MEFYVYIIHSQSLDRYYIGCTENIESRLIKHLQNHKGFTSRGKDWKLVYSEKFPDKKLALAREKEIKNWKSRRMIEKLISQNSI
ncbi:GIY-YIG nuclease family protein [Gramella sp. GC03-9]|uniref:GIY-YIG nuclease family protein n=1 Tax=Christiangramia oceanisediminis TaxID=2920386 RepID=A0A9X2L0C2_9FLAO|nr:GIY-YIG nuclease family protein [Gramella oceanisediminis]MCP9201600.1 GIY-YIG nuclease family protein [Gramella oceanisediminis]